MLLLTTAASLRLRPRLPRLRKRVVAVPSSVAVAALAVRGGISSYDSALEAVRARARCGRGLIPERRVLDERAP